MTRQRARRTQQLVRRAYRPVAATGAVAGAGIAAIAGGSGWTGAAVGAVADGVVGHMKGSQQK